jgi:hypothetical protein
MQSRLLLFTALAVTSAIRGDMQEDRSMQYAREASAMLGPTLWKRVIHVHNTSAESRYPSSFGAVVFEMSGILWFYTATDGTQSLSLFRGRASQDERNLSPLLARIDSGFSRWEFVSEGADMKEGNSVPPNACFIQSVALLRHILAAGMDAEHARLLSYYVTIPTGLKGHTVLFLETSKGPTVIDPLMQRWPIRICSSNPGDAKCVAYSIRHDVTSARWVLITPGDFAVNRVGSARFANN